MRPAVQANPARTDATRHSLIERLGDWGDRSRWQQFFDTYWRLIYSVARRSGLSDAEAHDVVQETVISVARNITRYDRGAGRFKSWLLQMTRWRIADQFRKRLPEGEHTPPDGSTRDTGTLDRIASPGVDLEAAWDQEWRERLVEAAMERVKRQVSSRNFQVFDCALRKQWPAAKIAEQLGVNIAQVYLIKHRLGSLLKKELRKAEEGEG
jgi:RNA polymerase sigma factor (sigma-70 family)